MTNRNPKNLECSVKNAQLSVNLLSRFSYKQIIYAVHFTSLEIFTLTRLFLQTYLTIAI